MIWAVNGNVYMKILEEKARQGLRQWHVMLTKKHCSSNKFEKCVVSTKTGKPAVYKARAQGTCWQKDLFALWQQEVENKATAHHTHHYFFCLTKRMTGWNHKDLCAPNREKWLAILTNIYGDLDKLSSNAKRIT